MFLTTMVLAIPGLIPMLASFRIPHNSVPDVKDWNDRAELYDGQSIHRHGQRVVKLRTVRTLDWRARAKAAR